MRYITDGTGRLLHVSFGADISCDYHTCREYTGAVPAGYASLESWYVAECEQMHLWKIEGADLVKDGSAAAPVEFCRADYVIEEGTTNGWTWRKWASGVSEAWGHYDVVAADCSTAAGAMFVTDIIEPAGMDFPAGLFLPYEDSRDDDRLTCQMTFTSYSGTPAIVWCDGFVHPALGGCQFRLMRHSAATITGRMQYSYKGHWKE